MSVTINQEVTYGLSIGTVLDDLGWPWTANSPYFAFFPPNFNLFAGQIRRSG